MCESTWLFTAVPGRWRLPLLPSRLPSETPRRLGKRMSGRVVRVLGCLQVAHSSYPKSMRLPIFSWVARNGGGRGAFQTKAHSGLTAQALGHQPLTDYDSDAAISSVNIGKAAACSGTIRCNIWRWVTRRSTGRQIPVAVPNPNGKNWNPSSRSRRGPGRPSPPLRTCQQGGERHDHSKSPHGVHPHSAASRGPCSAVDQQARVEDRWGTCVNGVEASDCQYRSGRAVTLDRLLFRRISASTRVHRRPPEQARRRVRAPWRPRSSPISLAVVSTALAVSAADWDDSVKTAHDMADRLRRRDDEAGLFEPQTRHKREWAG